MKKRILITTFVAVSIMGASVSSYAFGLGDLTGGNNSKGGGTDLSATQTQTVNDYVAASTLLLSANGKMSEALGLKEQVAKYKETADSLTAGTSEDSNKKADEALSNGTQAISDAMKNKPQLSAESKAKFTAGLVDLAAGTVGYAKVGKDVSSAQSAISSASPMQLMKLGELVYLAKSAPASIKSYSSALSSAISFAKENKIEVPKSATDALGSM